MEDKFYTVKDLSWLLDISTTAVCELKKKLGYRRIDDRRFLELQRLAEDIKRSQISVTTSTINMYLIEKEKERKFKEKRYDKQSCISW